MLLLAYCSLHLLNMVYIFSFESQQPYEEGTMVPTLQMRLERDRVAWPRSNCQERVRPVFESGSSVYFLCTVLPLYI